MRFFKASLSLIFLKLFLTISVSFGQSLTKYRIGAEAELGTLFASDSSIPFWLRTNQFGVIPSQAPAVIGQVKIWRDYALTDSLKNKKKLFDWGFVVNPVSIYEKANKFSFVLPEAHVKVRYKSIEFFAGRRRELMGLGDSVLSSGFYAVSGNALPIPKVQIGTVGYVPVAFKKFLSINAGFAHGWINTPPYIYGARFHQKYLYFRLGKPVSKSKWYFGINHQATWAGHSDYLLQRPDLATNGRLPDDWKYYKYIVLGYTPKDWQESTTITYFDSYRIGNHLGSYDIAFETKVNGNKLLLYHQHAFEDVSSLAFQNFPDGLYGANLVLQKANKFGNFKLTRLTLEFLTTKDQSGSEFNIPGSIFQGGDNYFNHTQYYEGWSYRSAGIGTPFITPRSTLDLSKPVSPRFFPNNRVSMFYLGAQGIYRKSLLLTLRSSYSRNYGMLGDGFMPPRNQFSFLLSGQLKLKSFYNTSLLAKLSVDQGDLFVNSYGGYLGIRKSW